MRLGFVALLAFAVGAIVWMIVSTRHYVHRLRGEIARQRALLDAHHDMAAVHQSCGPEAVALANRRECPLDCCATARRAR